MYGAVLVVIAETEHLYQPFESCSMFAVVEAEVEPIKPFVKSK